MSDKTSSTPETPDKDPLASSLKALKEYVLLIAALVAAGLYLNYLTDKIPHDYKVFKWLIWSMVLIILLFLYFFNIRPGLRKRRALKMRPTGEALNDYFTTSPRNIDTYQFFAKGYAHFITWLRHPKSSILYLTGASGVGKSSLINAYILPKLEVLDNGQRTEVFVVRTYHNPLKQIQNAFSTRVCIDNKEVTPVALIEMINEVCNLLAENERMLIILDQFEEFFLLRASKNLTREESESNNNEEEIKALKQFFNLYFSTPPKKTTILLSYRDDFQLLVDQLELPARNEHINFEQLNPLTYSQAKNFFQNCPGINIPEERLENVLEEAGTIDSPLTIRPIVLNILGIIILRMVNHPHAWEHEGNLIRQYILQGLGKEIRAERATVLKNMLNDFNTASPRSVEQLAIVTGLHVSTLDNQLMAMSRHGLVRCLDKEEINPSMRKWQIAHDFIALQLERVVHGLSVTAWRKIRPWLAPTLILLLIFITANIYSKRYSDAVKHLNENGLLWDGVSKTIYSNPNVVGISTSQLNKLSDEIVLLAPDSLKISSKNLISLEWLEKVTKLKFLDLSNCGHLTNIEGLKNLTTLVSLNLSNCYEIRNLDALKNLTTIITLNLSACRNLTSADGLINLSALKSLDFSFCDRLSNINGLKTLTSLIIVDLTSCRRLINVNSLANLSVLTSLNLSNCDSIINVDGLKNLTALTSLDLSKCKSLTNVNGLKNLIRLDSLNLSNCHQIRNLDALKNLTTLTTLNLSACGSLTNIDALKNLITLTTLDLSACSSLTTIDALKKLTSLSFLNLSYCDSIINVDGLKILTRLTSLSLSNCSRLINVDALEALTRLTFLDLSNCHRLTSVDPLQNLTDLRHLNLSKCKLLTSVTRLKNLVKLNYLDLTFCSKLGKDDIAYLRKELPHTFINHLSYIPPP